MTSRSTWGQGTGQNSECDFLNMLPDDEYLELCSPVFLPTANPSQFSSRGRLNAAGHVWMNNPEAYSAVPASLPAQSDEQPRSFPNDLDAKRAAKRMRTEQLNAWGLSTDEQYSNPDMPDDDDDQLTCSSCPDVCPSNCGETGQGLICCDSDDCEAQPEEDLCVDQACEGAISPCTDENCLVEPIAACGIKEQPHYESVDNSSSVAPPDPKEEAEAAAALTSFGDLGELGSVNSFSEGNPFNGFNNGFSLGTSSQQLSSQGQGAHSMAFGPQFNTNASNGQSSIFPFAPFPSGPNDGSYGPSPQPANVELFSHIFQYHGPSDSHTDHMRPCLADNPNIFGSRCPLPDPTSNEPISHTSDNGQSPGLRCDFTAEDPARFTDHLLSAHRWHLQSLTNLNAALGYIAWNQLRQGYGNINQGFGGANRANNSLSGSPLQAFYPNVNGGPVGQTSTSATPGTDSPISTTPLPTPDSPLTAHSLEPGSESILESRDTSPVTGRPGQSLGPQNAYQCFWGDPETGEPCGQNFGNSDELDSHCKAAHTKNLAKGPGGFQCSWESCKRGKDFFLTKAKLNRHLQTHTGCEFTYHYHHHRQAKKSRRCVILTTSPSQTHGMSHLRPEAVGQAGTGPAHQDPYKRTTLQMPVRLRKDI